MWVQILIMAAHLVTTCVERDMCCEERSLMGMRQRRRDCSAQEGVWLGLRLPTDQLPIDQQTAGRHQLEIENDKPAGKNYPVENVDWPPSGLRAKPLAAVDGD